MARKKKDEDFIPYDKVLEILEEDDDDIEEGCIACGNPAYPDCKTSCPMFDD